MWKALQSHAAQHALAYAVAMALALSASLSAIYDNFWTLTREQYEDLWWGQLIALWAKCLNPGVIALVAYLMKSPLTKDGTNGNGSGTHQPTKP